METKILLILCLILLKATVKCQEQSNIRNKK